MVDLKQTEAVESYNEESLNKLAWVINTSAGKFNLTLAYCNYPSLRRKIIQQLKNRYSIEKLHLKKSDDKLLTPIRDYCKQNQNKLPTALMVLGLESVTSLDVLVKATNFSRDSFKKEFPFPLVLWVNDLVLGHIIRQAPDFKSWAKTIKFLLPAEKLITTLHKKEERLFKKILNAGSGKFISNKDIFGQSYRSELDSALKDLEECGQILDEQLKASLDFFEGREKYVSSLGKNNKKELIDESLQFYQKSLEFWRNTHQLERQAVVQYHIGLCYSSQADLENESSKIQLLEQSQSSFKECVDTLRKTKNEGFLAKFINQLAFGLQRLADCYQSEIDKHKNLLDELEKIAEESKKLQTINQNLVLKAEALGFQAYVACLKKNWQSANNLSQQAVNLIKEVSEDKKMQPYLFYLAQSQWNLAQQNKAIETLEKASKLGIQNGLELYLHILETLYQYYRKKQDYLKAFRVTQKRRSVERQFHQQVFIGPGYLSPGHDLKPEIASEIECCPSRMKNLEELSERIKDGSRIHRLIILHGLPGVGKSSLLRAGLIPALKKADNNQKKEYIPIILSTSSGSNDYQDWLRCLEEKIAKAKALGNGSYKFEGRETLTFEGRRTLIESLINFLKAKVNKPSDKPKAILLIFDDFEEFFSSPKITDDFQLICYFFANCLKEDFIDIIISIREDYLPNLLDLEKELSKKFGVNLLDILSNSFGRYRLEYLTKNDAKLVIQNLTRNLNWDDSLIDKFLDKLDQLTNKPGQVCPLDLQLLGELVQAKDITSGEQFDHIEEAIPEWLKGIIDECGYKKVALIVLYLLTIPEDSNICPRKTTVELSGILELVYSGLLKQQDSSQSKQKLEELNQEDLNRQINVVLEILTGRGIVIKESDAQYQLVNEDLRKYIQDFAEKQLGTELCKKLKQPETAIKRIILIEEIKQLNAKADALFLDQNQLDSLLCSLKASKKFQDHKRFLKGNKELKDQTMKTLKKIFYTIQERNRFTKHTKDVYCVSFSLNEKEEEQLIASGGADQTIKLWKRNGELYKDLKGHDDWVTAVCFSPDGQVIASASADHTIKLWTRNGDCQKTLGAEEHKDWVRDVRFSPDGKLIASASKVGNDKDWTIQLWEIATGKAKELKSPMRHKKRINCVTFSPDGKLIASASDDGSVKLWNLDGTKFKIPKYSDDHRDSNIIPKYSDDHRDGHRGAVNSVTFDKKGEILVSASSDETIKLWDLQGKCLATLRGHLEIVRWVKFNPSGKLLVSASDDHTVKVWSIDRTLLPNDVIKIDGTLLTTFEGHDDCVCDVTFSPDGKIIASASEDNTVRLWDLDVVFPQNLQAHEDKIWRISFSPDSKFLATGSSDNIIKLWKFEDGQPKLRQELRGHEDWVWGINFSPDGKIMVSGGGDKTIKLWKWDEALDKYSEFKSLDNAHVDCVCCLKFSPDGELLASASADKTIKLWNPDETDGKPKKILSGYPKKKNPDGHKDRVYSIDFSPDSPRIVSVSADCSLKIWDCSSGEIIKSIDKGDKDNPGHTESINQACFSPNGERIASASNDNTIKIWDRDGNHQKTIKGHRYKVWSVRFLNDEILVSVGDDKAIKFWDLEGEELNTNLKGVSNRITNIKISPDKKTLAASTNHGIIQLWDLDQVIKTTLSFEGLIEAANNRVQDYEKSLKG